MAESMAAAVAEWAAQAGWLEFAAFAAEYGATVIEAAAIIGSAYQVREQQRKAQNAARSAYEQSLRDRYVMVRSSTEARKFVLGRQRVSGPMVFVGSYGVNRDRLVGALIFSAEEADAIESVYFDDERVTLDEEGNVTAISRRDLFTLQAASDVFTLSSDPAEGSVAAVARYGTTEVELGVSVVGRAVTVTGGTSGASALVTITYRPAASYWVVDNVATTTQYVTLDGTGGGSLTLTSQPDAGSLHVVWPAPYGDLGGDVNLDAYTALDGLDVTITGATTPGQQVAVSYTTTATIHRATMRFHLGAAGQEADAGMIAALPGVWTTAHKLSGLAYGVFEFVYDPDAFPGGLPNVSVVMRGSKVWDFRTDVTQWSENPALLAYHVATHPLLGRRSSSVVDLDSFAVSANACDRVVSYNVDGMPYVRNLFTAGTVASTDVRPWDILQDLARAMGGAIRFNRGMLTCQAGVWREPVPLTITEDWITDADAIEVQQAPTRSDLFNHVTGTFVNEEQDFIVMPYPSEPVAEYVALDGAELPLNAPQSAVTFGGQCQHLAAIALRDARQGLRAVLPCRFIAICLDIGDIVPITLSLFGWAEKLFEVIDKQLSVDGGVRLSVKETDESIFDLADTFSSTDPAPNTLLPSWSAVPDIEGLDADSGTDHLQLARDGTLKTRVHVTWNQISDAYVVQGGGVEVRYGRASEPEERWRSVRQPGGQDGLYLVDGVNDLELLLLKARAYTTLTRGKWCAPILHAVVGKTASPSDGSGFAVVAIPTGLRFTWDKPTDLDWAAAEVHEEATWSDATVPIFTGPTTSFEIRWPSAGSHTYLLKHVDRSGNRSTNAVGVAVVVGDASLIDSAQIVGEAITAIQVATGGFMADLDVESAYGVRPYYTGIWGVLPITLTEETTVLVSCSFEAYTPGSSSAQLWTEFFIVLDNDPTKYGDRVLSAPLTIAEPTNWPLRIEHAFTLPAGVHVFGACMDFKATFRSPPWSSADFAGDVTTRAEIIRR